MFFSSILLYLINEIWNPFSGLERMIQEKAKSCVAVDFECVCGFMLASKYGKLQQQGWFARFLSPWFSQLLVPAPIATSFLI